MKKAICLFCILTTSLVFAHSETLKIQAKNLNTDAFKLSQSSTTGKGELVMACKNMTMFNLRSRVENLDLPSTQTEKLSPNKKNIRRKKMILKKANIKDISTVQASLLSQSLLIEALCGFYYRDQNNEDLQRKLSQAFKTLENHSQEFLALSRNSK